MASGPELERAAGHLAGEPLADPLVVISAHVAVVQPDLERVREALGRVAELGALDPAAAAALNAQLAALVRTARNSAVPLIFDHLLAALPRSPEAASLLAALLRAARADLASRALAELPAWLRGGVRPDAGLAAALEELAARTSPAADPATLLSAAGVLLTQLQAELGASSATDLLRAAWPRPVRLLAARVLDGSGEPASQRVARAVLGVAAARVLAPHLAYTRATHRELVELTPTAGECPCAASLAAAARVLGEAALGRVLAELRWPRVVWGVTVEPVVALSFGDGLPVLVQPAEAALLEACAPARRLWQGHVLVAYGSEGGGNGGADAGSAEAVRRFRAYNLQHAALLAELLDLSPVTRGKVRRSLALLEEVTRAFAELFAAEDPEAASAPAVFAALAAPLAAAVGAGAADEPVSPEVARQVQRFEDPPSLAAARTLHGLKRYLHQRGLRNALRRFRSGGRAERTVDLVLLREDEAPLLVQRIRYADLEPQATSSSPPSAVRLITGAFQRHLLHGGTSLPSVLALLYGNEVQVYVQYRNHPAFVRLDLSPPRHGGMIDLEYFAVSQYELAQHPARDVPAIRTLLERLGFHVQLDGVRLHARYDKEAAADLGDLREHAAALFALLPQLMDLDWTVGSLAYPRAARELIAGDWAELFLRLGVLPVPELLTADRAGVVAGVLRDALGERAVAWDPEQPYQAAARALLPAGLIPAARAELERRGWSPGAPVALASEGQLALEQVLLQPVRAALARGELIVAAGELQPARGRFQRVPEAEQLARLMLVGGTPMHEAAALAARLRQLERELPLRETGAVNGWSVEFAMVPLTGGSIGLALLRDPDGVARLASAADDGVWYRTRADEQSPWSPVRQLAPDTLLRRLLAENCIVPDRELELPDTELHAAGILEEVAASRALGTEGDSGGARTVPGRAGSPGRASGFARIRPAGALRPGGAGVLLAPDIGPADAQLLRAADAVVSTGGGVLSHIGLLALELGKPSLIVAGEWRTGGGSSPVLALPRTEFTEEVRELEGLRVACRTAQHVQAELVRDGDLLVVDADRGELQLLGSDHLALALHDGLTALAEVCRAPARQDADPLVRRGDLIRTMHQLEKLVARLQRPELADYLVQELGLGPLAAAAAAAPYRRQLLAALQANAAVGAQAVRACARLLARMREEWQRAAAHLHQLMPLGGPLELLYARLLVRRAAERLRDMASLEGSNQVPAADPLGIALRVRLGQQRAGLEAALVATVEPWQRRHQLATLQLLEAVVPAAGAPPPWRLRLEAEVAAGDRRALAALEGVPVVTGAGGGLELAPIIGPKAASLGECTRVLGPLAVPPWFALTDHAFRQALRAPVPRSGRARTLADAIAELTDESRPRRAEEWERLAARIRQSWLEVVLPPDLDAAILTGYRSLAAGPEPPCVAVRSSALEEDSPAAAWAGQFDTFLFIRGERALLEHVRLAWAGLWSSRALQHRAASPALPPHAGGGIIVQHMVPARVAGVVQTVCAAAGRLRELVINVALGLGEGVVTGTVGVDEIRVHKPRVPGGSLQLQYRVGDKRESVCFDAARGTGTRREPTLYHQRLRAALEYPEIEALVRAALALEQAWQQPLDIEFAFVDHAPVILQARPIPLFHAAWRETITRAPLPGSTASLQPELIP